MNILLSTSYNPILPVPAGVYRETTLSVMPRRPDWDLGGIQLLTYHFMEVLRLIRRARNFDAVVVCNAGREGFLLGRFRRFLPRRTTLVCLDLLMPKESRMARMATPWLEGVDAFICIRRGDIPVLQRRFGVPESKCHFEFFPASEAMLSRQTVLGDYVYSAGWAHRDWSTAMAALTQAPYPAILSAGVPLIAPIGAEDRIRCLPMQTPAQGRDLMTGAGVVLLSLEDTDLPSGPLVLLDAMAAGKGVVATSVNGTRDYIDHGRTGLLVPPKQPEAMARAIASLMDDREARKRMGAAARREARASFTLDRLMETTTRVCRDARPV